VEATDVIPTLRFAVWKNPLALATAGHRTFDGVDLSVSNWWNALGVAPLRSWADVEPWLSLAGGRIVVQAEFGHSGQTTWFISSCSDYAPLADVLAALRRLRISRYVSCDSLTVDACATRNGTVMGPLLHEFTGVPTLTPFKGGWCGNHFESALFSREERVQAAKFVQRIGDSLTARGYRGCFGVDLLRHRETGELLVTEVNGRFTGASPVTNYVSSACAGVPLVKFHFDEYRGLADPAEIAAFNAQLINAAIPESVTMLAIAAPACKVLGYLVMRGLPLGPTGDPHPIAQSLAASLRGRFGWRSIEDFQVGEPEYAPDFDIRATQPDSRHGAILR